MGPERATEVAEAVCSGYILYRVAANIFGISVVSLQKRVDGSVGIGGRVGPGAVLSTEEETCLEDTLEFAADRHLSLNRYNLK